MTREENAIGPDLGSVRGAISARGLRIGEPLSIVASCASTNDDAKHGAREGAPHGAVWLAEAQTRGRGRQGRTWTSAPGESLLFSVLLRVLCPPSRVPQLSLACGLSVRDAVARAVEDDAAVLVKWPNDVLVRGHADGRLRKVAGVLVESSLSGSRVEHVIVGIGLNVHTVSFPAELSDTATSVALERAARGLARRADRSAILADVLGGLERDVEAVACRGLVAVHARLTAHDALVGCVVEGDSLSGTAAGIDEDGRLLVRTTSGDVVRAFAGEVRLAAR